MGGESGGILGHGGECEDVRDGTNVRARCRPNAPTGSLESSLAQVLPAGSIDFKTPLQEVGDIAYEVAFKGQLSLKGQGSYKTELASPGNLASSGNQDRGIHLRVKTEGELSDHLKGRMVLFKLDDEFCAGLRMAIGNGSLKETLLVFVKRLEATLDYKLPGESGVGIEAGLKVSQAFFTAAFYWETTFGNPNPSPGHPQTTFRGKVTLGLGFSKRGLAKLALRPEAAELLAGRLTVSRVLAGVGTGAVASVLTFGIQVLSVYLTVNAMAAGAKRTAARMFATAYTSRVFGKQPPAIPAATEDVHVYLEEAIALGQREALRDASENVKRANVGETTMMSEEEIFVRFRALIRAKYGSNDTTTIHFIQLELVKQVQGQLGSVW